MVIITSRDGFRFAFGGSHYVEIEILLHDGIAPQHNKNE
jgi:hypothetical protein